MKENFPNLVKEIVTQVQKAQRVPKKMDAKRPTPRHIKIKCQMLKTKKILKAARQKQLVTCRGVPIIDCQLISQKKICKLEGIGKKYSKSLLLYAAKIF